MKKIDIIQTTLIIIAVLNAYNALYTIIALVTEVPMVSGPGGQQALIAQFLISALVTSGVFLIIRYSRPIAAWLLRFDPEGDAEGSARWHLDRRTLIFALFIGIGALMLINALPDVAADLFYAFKSKVSRSVEPFAPNENQLLLQLLKVALGALIVYAAPGLTGFIEKSIAVRLKGQPSEIAAVDPDPEPETQSS
ncbi:MAG TPA: hypothetical protein VGQ51_08885 [Puia sp.]|jgi:hypothetical protein|nr:hypothetical protein [Puia sp.]